MLRLRSWWKGIVGPWGGLAWALQSVWPEERVHREQAMVALAASHEIASPPSVLITDDNDGWRQAVEDVLESAGFHTLQASSG